MGLGLHSGLKRLLYPVGAIVVWISGGCAHSNYPYKYYCPELPSYSGKLLGDDIENDIQFSQCEPDELDRCKCIVSLKEDFLRQKTEYLRIQQELIECQKDAH